MDGDLMEKSWGGSRKGSGRKTLSDNVKHKGYTFQLTQEDIEFIERFKGDSRSESLRNLIDEYKNLKERIDNSR
jgi:hypothetical protein